MNILFTCAGRRTYLLQYFKEQLAGDGLILGADMQLSAPALSVADVAVIVPEVYSPVYIDNLMGICLKYSVDMLISLNDLELPILAKAKMKFKQIGVNVIISSEEVINICFDKLKTNQFVKSIGLVTPKTWLNLDEATECIKGKEACFPLILKPRWGSGSIGIEIVVDEEELRLTYALLKKKIKRTILAHASVGDDYILIQQMIKGKEYGLDIINDFDGNNVAVSVKEKLAMRAGETDKAITVDNPSVRAIGMKIGANLKHIGNLDCDILEQGGAYYVLEFNPRFGGGFPFSYEAGVNLPKAYIEWNKGNTIDKSILVPKYDEVFAKCDILVRR